MTRQQTMAIKEFEKAVFYAAQHSPLCDIPQIVRLTAISIKLRIELWSGGVIEAFFNEDTGTTAFALIRNEQRIFGADNAGGWHQHPFTAPEKHEPISKAMSFAEFVAEIERHENK